MFFISIHVLVCSLLLPLVFKDKPHSSHTKKPPEHSSKLPPSALIPVVGENEPELKMAGTVNSQKRKLDPSQLATDDYHFDKYRKRTRHY